jgi:ectoine hydroxylase-related dioxygenase (phytanoyl-CoA dioxygenase family)
MTKLLTEDAVAKYRRDGYYFPIDVLSEAETRELRSKLEAHERSSGGPIQGDRRHKPHLYLTFLNDLIRQPRILDAVEDVLGPNLLCWSTSFFIKEASDAGFVSWHQDATYWGLSSPDVMTVWVAFTPANLLNGCMKFMPGSHREQLEHVDTFDKNNLLSRGQEIAVKVDESKGVDVILKPGQASLHHVLLAHGSEPNKSNDRRIGFAIRYIPTHVRQAVGAEGQRHPGARHRHLQLLRARAAADRGLHARIAGRPMPRSSAGRFRCSIAAPGRSTSGHSLDGRA